MSDQSPRLLLLSFYGENASANNATDKDTQEVLSREFLSLLLQEFRTALTRHETGCQAEAWITCPVFKSFGKDKPMFSTFSSLSFNEKRIPHKQRLFNCLAVKVRLQDKIIFKTMSLNADNETRIYFLLSFNHRRNILYYQHENQYDKVLSYDKNNSKESSKETSRQIKRIEGNFESCDCNDCRHSRLLGLFISPKVIKYSS